MIIGSDSCPSSPAGSQSSCHSIRLTRRCSSECSLSRATRSSRSTQLSSRSTTYVIAMTSTTIISRLRVLHSAIQCGTFRLGPRPHALFVTYKHFYDVTHTDWARGDSRCPAIDRSTGATVQDWRTRSSLNSCTPFHIHSFLLCCCLYITLSTIQCRLIAAYLKRDTAFLVYYGYAHKLYTLYNHWILCFLSWFKHIFCISVIKCSVCASIKDNRYFALSEMLSFYFVLLSLMYS